MRTGYSFGAYVLLELAHVKDRVDLDTVWQLEFTCSSTYLMLEDKRSIVLMLQFQCSSKAKC